jgi:hypothetical protein
MKKVTIVALFDGRKIEIDRDSKDRLAKDINDRPDKMVDLNGEYVKPSAIASIYDDTRELTELEKMERDKNRIESGNGDNSNNKLVPLLRIVDDQVVVMWTWRKKTYTKETATKKMQSGIYYELDRDRESVTIAWRAPREIDVYNNSETYPESVEPCTPTEVTKLNKMFKQYNPHL